MNFNKALFTIAVLFGGLILGFLYRVFVKEQECYKFSKEIMVFLTKVIAPVIVCFSFWVIDISKNIGILTLPLIGFLLSAFAIFPARFFSKLHKLNRRQKGSYITCAMFSNVGYTLGGFLAFVLLGEVAFGLTVLYCLYFKPFFYTVGFYAAEYYGSEGKFKAGENLRRIFTEGIRLFPLLGLGLGVILNLSGISRPLLFADINRIFVPLSTFGFLFAIGMTLKFSAVKGYKKEFLSMSLIKFVLCPLAALIMAYLMGYGQLMDKLPLKVVFIESVMPVAIASLVLPNLFNLDSDLSNACWLFTTLLIIPLLPFIILVLNLL